MRPIRAWISTIIVSLAATPGCERSATSQEVVPAYQIDKGTASVETNEFLSSSHALTAVDANGAPSDPPAPAQPVLEKLCLDPLAAGNAEVDKAGQAWRESKLVEQSSARIDELDQEFGLVGHYYDGIRRRVVFVFHQDAKNIALALETFRRELGKLPFAAYYACFPRSDLERFENYIERGAWRSSGKGETNFSASWQITNATWKVSISTTDLEVVKALREAAGPVAEIEVVVGRTFVRDQRSGTKR
jgi:hypothetical protein